MTVDASVGRKGRAAAATAEPEVTPDLAEVFDAHAAYVGRTLRCLGVREREIPDAIQDVFLVVHRRLSELRKPSALRSWLYAICVRKAMSLRRRAARRREDAAPDAALEGIDGRTPHDELERTRALASALAILEGLDDEKRAVFVLYEVEQLPMREIAEALEIPLQTGFSRLYAARREIGRLLERKKARGEVER